MKRYVLIVLFSFWLTVAPTMHTRAVPWVVIKEIVKKVIRQIDLIVQQIQNKTIWLQNAQKQLENVMSKLKLEEIGDWAEKQRKLYADYYDELKKVKDLIAYYKRVKDVTEKQIRLVEAYKKAFALFKNDRHFTIAEINYMERVYTGMVDASVKNLDQIILVINSFSTQMTDAKRLEIINAAADRIDKNYADLV
ncbi:MAG TPA: conjugal transfer protein TraI, partial [Agriterribacter sp.]|nr:conjugal transfer protein TraI [Agriterribacter sp.]